MSLHTHPNEYVIRFSMRHKLCNWVELRIYKRIGTPFLLYTVAVAELAAATTTIATEAAAAATMKKIKSNDLKWYTKFENKN